MGSLSLPDPSCLSLPENAVHVWVLDEHLVGQACSLLGHTLSLDEWQRARNYKHERNRNRFVARRSILRWLIGRYLTCKPESLRFSVTQFGKPALQWPHAGARLAFNVSHTDGLAALAFALDCRIGVDVQRIDGVDVTDIEHEMFSSAEEEALGAARLDSAATFVSIWTRKEALLKAFGTGFSVEPKSYTTEDDSELGENRWRASLNGAILSGWRCLDLDLGREVRGALAVSLDDARVTLHHCSLST